MPIRASGAAEEGVERQLHRAVFLVGRTPDRDEEIFRDDNELVENEEQEKIGAEKNAVGPADDEEEPEEEFVRPVLDVPGKEDGADGGQAGDQAHRQADAVDREVVFESEPANPGKLDDCFEAGRYRVAVRKH